MAMNKHPIKFICIHNLQITYIYYSKNFLISLLVCMLCQSKFLIIPNSQGLETLNWLVSLTSRTLDVINRLFSQVLTQTQSLVAHIHFAISILYPFFTSVDPRYPGNLPSPTHTHACKCTHVCTCVDTYTCTPRQMGDL